MDMVCAEWRVVEEDHNLQVFGPSFGTALVLDCSVCLKMVMFFRAPVVFRWFFILLMGVGAFIRIMHVATWFGAFGAFYVDESTVLVCAELIFQSISA